MGKQKFSFWLFMFSSVMFIWLFFIFLKSLIVASLLVMSTLMFAGKIEAYLAMSKFTLASRHKELVSASVLTLIFGIAVFAPVGYFIVYAIGDIAAFDVSNILVAKSKIELSVNSSGFLSEPLKQKIIAYLNELFSEEFLIFAAKNTFTQVSGFLKGVASSFAELLMIVVFFFLLHWFKSDIGTFVSSVAPIDESDKNSIAKEIINSISVVFLTLFGIMIAQGLAFSVLMLFFGYNAPLLGCLAALAAVVPIFGTALVWVPVALSELAEGNIFNAVAISIYCWFVMAILIDNFLWFFLLGKIAKIQGSDYRINEFLIFFSIAAGIAAFGFWGFIIGPSITALFLSSAKLYRDLK